MKCTKNLILLSFFAVQFSAYRREFSLASFWTTARPQKTRKVGKVLHGTVKVL